MSDQDQEKRSGPSNFSLSLGGLIAVIALAGSGIATYNTVQNDISNLKRGEEYQKLVNDQAREERIAIRAEHRETARELNEKADRIIEKLGEKR